MTGIEFVTCPRCSESVEVEVRLTLDGLRAEARHECRGLRDADREMMELEALEQAEQTT